GRPPPQLRHLRREPVPDVRGTAPPRPGGQQCPGRVPRGAVRLEEPLGGRSGGDRPPAVQFRTTRPSEGSHRSPAGRPHPVPGVHLPCTSPSARTVSPGYDTTGRPVSAPVIKW